MGLVLDAMVHGEWRDPFAPLRYLTIVPSLAVVCFLGLWTHAAGRGLFKDYHNRVAPGNGVNTAICMGNSTVWSRESTRRKSASPTGKIRDQGFGNVKAAIFSRASALFG